MRHFLLFLLRRFCRPFYLYDVSYGRYVSFDDLCDVVM